MNIADQCSLHASRRFNRGLLQKTVASKTRRLERFDKLGEPRWEAGAPQKTAPLSWNGLRRRYSDLPPDEITV
jgi:hypothetical protein